MRKTNIAFSGFMAAILFSAGAANAATQIASKQYVDNRETSILQTVSNTYETKENVTNLTEQVTQLGDTINNAETGLKKQVEGAVSTAEEAKTTADEAKAGLDAKEDKSNKAAEINEGNQTSPTAYPSVGAIVQWTNKKIADLSDTGLPVNPGNIEDGTIAGSKLENGAVTTDKIADDAVTSDKIADDAVGSEHIQTGAVGTDEIADGAVGNADLAADSVTTDKIKDGTISTADLDTALNAEIDGKEDKTNKVTAITGSEGEEANRVYPTVGAVTAWTQQQIENVEFDPSELAPGSINGDAIQDGSISGDKITDGTITSDQIADGTVGTGDIADGAITGDKLDEALAGQIADIDGKQDIAMGVGHENHIVTTDASGNITSAATIGQDKVTGLTTVLAGKASIDDIPTTVAELTDASNYATTGALTSGLADKEDTSNKTKLINDGNKSSETLFPTIGAITTWTDQQIQQLSTEGIPVNPDNIGPNAITTDKIANGAVTTEKLADDSVTEDKLSNDVVASIDAKLPAPDADCVADSNLCVLTVTPSGDLAWVAVTQPAE